MIIYKITNLLNGKSYIGQTRQKLSTRWRQHCYGSSHSIGLKGAVAKYGKDAFSVEILFETGDQAALDAKEIEFIRLHRCLVPQGYNLTTGGEGGYTRSEETRKRISEAGKGKGRPHTDASRAKLSAAHMGDKNPMHGKRMSPEHRAKIAAALRGRKRTQAEKDSISAGHRRRQLPGQAA